MYTIDITSDINYYIIFKDNQFYCRVAKSNSINDVKTYFNISD